MAKTVKPGDKEQVARHIAQLEPGIAATVQAIRSIFLKTDKEIDERIKWNNPSFYFTGEMSPSDPKEYKREIAVFNLFKGRIMLVFPGGAKVSDPAKLLTGDYKDGRRLIIFADLADAEKKSAGLKMILQDWLRLARL